MAHDKIPGLLLPGSSAWPWAVLSLAVLLNLGLAFNPGYFSHDELQWGHFARAQTWSAMPWNAFGDFAQFQYRPLTFNVWLILSRLLFDTPVLMHAAFVLLGLGNAGLVAWVARGGGASLGLAATAAALFLVSPYAVYVHGWVATLADLLWVACALAAVGIVSRAGEGAGARVAWVGAGLCALGLLAKESALSIPMLLLVSWGASGDRRWAWATLGAGLVCAVYLVLRLDVLLGGATATSGYPIEPGAPPRRLAEYLSFVYDPARFEVSSLAQMHSTRLAGATLVVLVATVAAMGRRTAVLFFAAAVAALAPVLVLQVGANQYGYGFAAVLAFAWVAAWTRAAGARKALLVLLAVVMAWHGLKVAQEMRRVGRIQAVYSAQLAEALARVPVDRGIVLGLECPSDSWIYLRLSHEVPAWRGMPIGSRASILESSLGADGEIRCDGRVVLHPASSR